MLPTQISKVMFQEGIRGKIKSLQVVVALAERVGVESPSKGEERKKFVVSELWWISSWGDRI